MIENQRKKRLMNGYASGDEEARSNTESESAISSEDQDGNSHSSVGSAGSDLSDEINKNLEKNRRRERKR